MKSKQESDATMFTVKLTMRVPLRDPADMNKTMDQIYKERQAARTKKEKGVGCKLGVSKENLTLSNGSWWPTGEFQSDLLYSQIIKHALLDRTAKVMLIISSRDKVHTEFVVIKTKGESHARQLNGAIRMRVEEVRAKERATQPVAVQPVQYQATRGDNSAEETSITRTRKKSRAPDVPLIEKVSTGKQMAAAVDDEGSSVDRLTSTSTSADLDTRSASKMPQIPPRRTNGYAKADKESNSEESIGNDQSRPHHHHHKREDSREQERYTQSFISVEEEKPKAQVIEKPKTRQSTLSTSDDTTSASNNEYPRIIQPRSLQSIEEDRRNGYAKVERESRQKYSSAAKPPHQSYQRNSSEPALHNNARAPDYEDYRSRTDTLSSVTYYGSNERSKTAESSAIQKPHKSKRRTNRELSSLTGAKNSTTEVDENNIPWEVNICYIKHDPMVGCVEDESGPIYMYTAHQLVSRNPETYSACESISCSDSSSESEDDSILASESSDDDDDGNELERFMMQGREENPRGQTRTLPNGMTRQQGVSTVKY
ncbi:unnamed protein product [Dibothriocephalus latus]|uniref:Uncharacterized protein n=1 Tax=Dibothriocephalus latus TaxID=60516 RepID=A0A3P6URF6_DIBLA|nr:unnamed protein product [Dibothriocephalus latus]